MYGNCQVADLCSAHALVYEHDTISLLNKVQKGVSHSNQSIAFQILMYSKSLQFFVWFCLSLSRHHSSMMFESG